MPESATTEPTEPETAGAATTESAEPETALPEADTTASAEPETALPEADPRGASSVDGAPGDGAAADVPAPRPVRRRAARADAVLVEARDVARAALADIARDDQIGEHAGTTVDGERLVTHSFASVLPGYLGWNWFVVLARAPRSRAVTVCEIGLAPGEGALLAPPWIPWADRLRPEDHEVEGQQPENTDATEAPEPAAGAAAADDAPAAADDTPADADETPADATAADDTEIVDDDATLLSRPEADGRELPGEEVDEAEPDLSAEAEDVRTEEETEDAVADGAEEATEA